MGEQRVHKAQQLQDWIFGNADRPITVREMAQAVGWTTSSTSTVASRLAQHFPDQMIRKSKGLYVWHSKPIAQSQSSDATATATATDDQTVKELFLRVIKSRTADGAMLAEDIEHPDRLFVVTPFEF